MSSVFNKFLKLSAIALAAFALVPAVALAQQVFRIVGPDGKVTFSDKPPPVSAAGATSGAVTVNSTAGTPTASLPFALRQVVAKYPVTFYTSDKCAPCGSARSMLITRGIPFVEKTISTFEDTEALQRLSGDNSLPFATIGGQQLNGYSDIEWTQFLNAAGYPASSVLPASYRAPAATPLVAAATAPVATATGAAPTARPAASQPSVTPRPAPSPSNPSGIRF